jgi:carbonic anhydrase
MIAFTNNELRAKLKEETGEDASDIDFLPFTDLEQSVRDDVHRIVRTPFIDPSITVSGYVYDVKTGALEQVVAPVTAATP